MAIKRMQADWLGLFRERFLRLMPVAKIAEHFHPTLGCPTKELYAMAVAIFLKEIFNMTIDDAVERYLTGEAVMQNPSGSGKVESGRFVLSFPSRANMPPKKSDSFATVLQRGLVPLHSQKWVTRFPPRRPCFVRRIRPRDETAAPPI